MEMTGQIQAPAALHPAKEIAVPTEKEARWDTGLYASEKRNITCPCMESNHDPSVVHLLA
jgi:hypothetical protein